MRKYFIICAVLTLLTVRCMAGDKHLVGGPCTYESFPGTCTLTGIDENGKANFEFKGAVKGGEVHLKDNKTMLRIAMHVDRPCELKFITSGTCTPCLLSMGECGKEAWELFRSSKP